MPGPKMSMLYAKHWAVMKPYQSLVVTVESAEKQSPTLLPTHTRGCDHTHMAGPNILHPGANNNTLRSKIDKEHSIRTRHPDQLSRGG